jgi:hypothetical protein
VPAQDCLRRRDAVGVGDAANGRLVEQLAAAHRAPALRDDPELGVHGPRRRLRKVLRESSPACGKVPNPIAGIGWPSFSVRVGMLIV